MACSERCLALQLRSLVFFSPSSVHALVCLNLPLTAALALRMQTGRTPLLGQLLAALPLLWGQEPQEGGQHQNGHSVRTAPHDGLLSEKGSARQSTDWEVGRGGVSPPH